MSVGLSATSKQRSERLQFRINGMDCARDAASAERAARSVEGAGGVTVSAASHILTFDEAPAADVIALVEEAVAELGYGMEPLPGEDTNAARSAAHHAPGYRRALWIVVVLNLGYGVVEMAGGIIAGSQAVLADALDFIGDGAITLLGLVAIGWGLAWRARAALVQGVFLGLLGAAVFLSTIYRAFSHQQPDPGMMGALAAVGLVVNLAAAAVLIPHRRGDANVRAVWLFSRNDAIGNVAVIAAAGLVALTASAWPDLLVALAIAALFLHSSTVIIRDARRDLRETTG
jgi:Co/Zn/Cd efflux system component